uniref:Vomeronasal type-1 receptor n=1 Tax=Cacopsylla melanoneura TaxID=428564 RepID=A0A8D8Q5W4_9HEMI
MFLTSNMCFILTLICSLCVTNVTIQFLNGSFHNRNIWFGCGLFLFSKTFSNAKSPGCIHTYIHTWNPFNWCIAFEYIGSVFLPHIMGLCSHRTSKHNITDSARRGLIRSEGCEDLFRPSLLFFTCSCLFSRE